MAPENTGAEASNETRREGTGGTTEGTQEGTFGAPTQGVKQAQSKPAGLFQDAETRAEIRGEAGREWATLVEQYDGDPKRVWERERTSPKQRRK